jgi:hypothetical protein
MKRKYLPLVLMLLTQITYSQSTVTLTADRDNTIYSESGTVSNGAGQHLFAGVTAQSTIRRALLHFDLSSIPAGAVINSATLTLHVNKQAASSQGVTLSRVNHDWGEGTSDAEQNEGAGTTASAGDVTWANSLYPASSWANPGGDFGTITVTIPTASPGINNITGEAIKADVESFINNPSINFGWIIRSSNETGSANALRFSSRENANTGQRPTLTINYSVSLPVELKEFKVEAQGRAAVLNWQTVTEVSNSHFEVEHSSDGIHFNSLAIIHGNGTSSSINYYSYKHPNTSAGKNYYRLKQYDYDGNNQYSGIVSLTSTLNPICSCFLILHLFP